MSTDFDYLLGGDIDDRAENAILKDTLETLSAIPDSLVYRHNTGQAWQGKRQTFYPGTRIPVPPGTVVLTNAHPVNFGLEGSGDIMGAMQQIPIAIETKTRIGRQRISQRNFEVAWTKAGGVYIVARSPAEGKRMALEAILSRNGTVKS